ncbi:hypothetical protein GCM10009117_06970 [Gangjinia marincola]|uniref:Uncharacterized protein n=1 Tax=Gangjinia marincola TaxID=578463 RepID=A0ABN1MEJ5_9FLAO
MKKIIAILFISILISIAVGFWIKETTDVDVGKKIIGVTILFTSFIFLPLFIYTSYKGKHLKDYTLSDENIKKMRDKNNIK